MVIIKTEKVCDEVALLIGKTPTSFLQILGEKVDKNEQLGN